MVSYLHGLLQHVYLNMFFSKCGICNVKFGRKDVLDQHVLTVHEGKKQFKCDICDASFGHKHNLNTGCGIGM